MRRAAPYLLLAITCLGLFFWRLGNIPLLGFDEGIYAECSREMAASGNYVVPTAYGRPFFDKPPLAYWLQAASIRAFGVDSFAVRLPSAVAAALLVALTAFLGTRVFDRRSGLCAGFVLATCMLTTGLARMCLLDQIFVLTITAALGAFLLAYLRIWPRECYLAFWAFTGLTMLTKGPAGAVLICGTVAAFLLIRRQASELGRMMPVAGLLVFAAITLPWYVLVQKATGGTFLREFIFHQNLQRAMGKDFSHNMPFYFYPPIYLLGFFPWSVFVPLAWRQYVRLRPSDKRGEAALFMAVAILFIAGTFSLLVSKLPSYIYPVFPASALLLGLMWSRAAEQTKPAQLKKYSVGAIILTAVIAAAMLAAHTKLPRPIPGLSLTLLLMNSTLMVGLALSLYLISTRRIHAAFAAVCAGTATFLIIATGFGLPIAARSLADPAMEMGRLIGTTASPGESVFAYRLRPAQPSLGFYAERFILPVKTGRELEASFSSSGVSLVITQKERPEGFPSGGRLMARIEPFYLYQFGKGLRGPGKGSAL